MLLASITSTITWQTICPNDRRKLPSSWLRSVNRRRPKPKIHFNSTRKIYAPIAYGSKTCSPSQIKMSIYAKEFLAIYMASKEFGHIIWAATKPVIIMTDSKSVTRFFQKMIPPPLWNAFDFVLQFNFTIAHIPGKMNTAADFLSRLEMDPNEKVILKIIEDIFQQNQLK